ncbi:MAG: hypothetical protein ABMA00_16565 [Gemmatimonas sp.]
MPSAREDYLLRMIQQMAAALRRMREKLGGGGSAEEVSHDAHAAITTLLGARHALFERLDARTAAQLMGDAERVQLWSDLLRLQADALEQSGDTARGLALRHRADALQVEASRSPVIA